MAAPATFSDVLDRLERDQARYVVVSGAAVVLHGHVRPIVDLDIAIDRSPGEARRTMSALAACGFVPTLPLPLDLLTVLRMFDRSSREVDVFVRYPVPFEELFSAAERLPLGDGRVRVASREHVIQVKRIAGRPHDLQDIEGLLSLGELGKGGPETGERAEEGG